MKILQQHYRLVLFSAIALGIGGLQIYFGRTPLPAAQAQEDIPAPQGVTQTPGAQNVSKSAYMGTASCAASNCHGGGGRGISNTEDPLSPHAYSIWIHKDPHSRAYSTLFNEASQNIARKLSAYSSASGSPEEVPAHKRKDCLNCHTINPPDEQLAFPFRHTRTDGVGCEACHGPASAWIDKHTRPDWLNKSGKYKKSFGFNDLDNLTERGKVCIDCHIGGEGRDVNHDLIAAGHPRLNFELSAYHASMPKHWQIEDAEGGKLDEVETRLLLVGQTLCAQAALEQLARRAKFSQTNEAPWPEFAEYDCYACHHQLSANSWRQQQKRDPDRKAGEYPWGTWYFTLLPELTKKSGQPDPKLDKEVELISRAMSVTYPDAQEVIKAVKSTNSVLKNILKTTQGPLPSSSELEDFIVRLTSKEQLEQGGDWEIEAQRFLAITSVLHALMAKQKNGSGDPLPEPLAQLKAELDVIRKAIVFTSDSDTEKYVSPHSYDSTRQAEVAESFGKIHQLFKSQ